jgi:DNA-binding transcriptional LysR family regulator
MQLFVRIVESGSFSAVARELGMIQPTVSKQMTALEEKLGVRLLNRTTRRLSMTDAGREYYERCQRILDEVQEMETEVTGLQNRPSGTLRVNTPVAFGNVHMLPLILAFRRQFPGVAIDLSLDDRYVDLIQEGIDVAIRFGELGDSQLVARHVGSSASVCVASPAYLSKHGTPETPSELQEHECITYSYLFSNEWPFDGPDGLRSIKVHGDLRANSGMTIRSAALEGAGIASVPAFLIREDIETGRLIQLLSQFAPAPIRISAVYPSARLLPRKVKLFVDFIQQEFLKIPLLHPRSPTRPIPRIRSKPGVAVPAS